MEKIKNVLMALYDLLKEILNIKEEDPKPPSKPPKWILIVGIICVALAILFSVLACFLSEASNGLSALANVCLGVGGVLLAAYLGVYVKNNRK